MLDPVWRKVISFSFALIKTSYTCLLLSWLDLEKVNQQKKIWVWELEWVVSVLQVVAVEAEPWGNPVALSQPTVWFQSNVFPCSFLDISHLFSYISDVSLCAGRNLEYYRGFFFNAGPQSFSLCHKVFFTFVLKCDVSLKLLF